jgi:hypothetical protein
VRFYYWFFFRVWQQKTWTGLPNTFDHRVVHKRWLAVLNLLRRDLVTADEVVAETGGSSPFDRVRCFGVDRLVAELSYRFVSSQLLLSFR